MGVPYPLAAVPDTTPVNPDTLIVGGGVAGIQAALEIADAGKQVYPRRALGHHRRPHGDVRQDLPHPRLRRLHPHAEDGRGRAARDDRPHDLRRGRGASSGSPGDYTVTVRKKARRVDEAACVACHACIEVCPQRTCRASSTAASPTRKAIYMPFPQAVPNAYLIDETDAAPTSRATARSAASAPRSAPRSASTSTRPTRSSSSRSATSSSPPATTSTTPRKIERYGYGVLPNVLTALEFERLTNASGPTGGKIVIKTKRLNKRTKSDEWVFDADEGALAAAASPSSTASARATRTTTPTARGSAACTRSSSPTS